LDLEEKICLSHWLMTARAHSCHRDAHIGYSKLNTGER
jgi:hypothetical protein